MDPATVRLIAGLLAAYFGVVIFLRHRNRNAD